MRLHLGKMTPIKPDEIGKTSQAPSPPSDDAAPKWAEYVARTTVALAVLAAVASGQNAGEFATTQLAQGEETDAWGYYQAKSVKGQMAAHQAETLRALAAMPGADPKLLDLAKTRDDERARYDHEAKERYDFAKKKQVEKGEHLGRSSSLAHSFVALQAGVILCTLATSRRNVRFWALAIAAGAIGLLLAVNAYLRVVKGV